MAVKLNQGFNTLYDMEYMEYSLLLNIINKDIDEENETMSNIDNLKTPNIDAFKVNLPSHLKLK